MKTKQVLTICPKCGGGSVVVFGYRKIENNNLVIYSCKKCLNCGNVFYTKSVETIDTEATASKIHSKRVIEGRRKKHEND